MDTSSQPPNPSGPPKDQSSFPSSHFPPDIRLCVVNWLTEHLPQLLSTEQMKNILSASQIDLDKVNCLIEVETLKRVIGHPVGLHEELSKYHIAGKPDQFMISNIPCFISTRCAPCKLSTPSSPAEAHTFLRALGDSGGGLYDTLGGGAQHEDKTIFHALAREVKEEAGQDLDYHLYPLTPRVWCKFKHQELQVHVAFAFLAVLPESGWKNEIILSEEHEDCIWITEDRVKDYKFHGTNEGIFLDAFNCARSLTIWQTL